MPKFKKPIIPRCPQLKLARATFQEANRLIREARLKYKKDCYDASFLLKGKALLCFAFEAATRMKKAGMYSKITPHKDVMWSLIRYFHYQESIGGWWASWPKWQMDRQISIGSVHEYHNSRRQEVA